LNWLTNSENQRHAHKEGLKPKAKLGKAGIRAIRRSTLTAKILADQYRVGISTIYKVKNGTIYKYI
jgi:hypothetical protein